MLYKTDKPIELKNPCEGCTPDEPDLGRDRVKYCDDIKCPKLVGGECALGFKIKFRVPKSMNSILSHNWGYVMAKACSKNKKLLFLASTGGRE